MGVHSNVLEPYVGICNENGRRGRHCICHETLWANLIRGGFVCIHTEYSIMKRTKWASYIIPTISAGLKKHGSTGCGTDGISYREMEKHGHHRSGAWS